MRKRLEGAPKLSKGTPRVKPTRPVPRPLGAAVDMKRGAALSRCAAQVGGLTRKSIGAEDWRPSS